MKEFLRVPFDTVSERRTVRTCFVSFVFKDFFTEIICQKNYGKATKPSPKPLFVRGWKHISVIPSPRKRRCLNISHAVCPNSDVPSCKRSQNSVRSTWFMARHAQACA